MHHKAAVGEAQAVTCHCCVCSIKTCKNECYQLAKNPGNNSRVGTEEGTVWKGADIDNASGEETKRTRF